MNSGRIIISALAASILAIPAMAADAPGYFKVPGTETTMKIYGRAQTWAYYNMDQSSGVATNADGTVITTAAHDQSWSQTGTVDSKVQGRFGVTSTTPTSYGDVTTKLEYEAQSGAGGDNNLHVRHAYGEFAGLLIGQTNSLFVDWQYCPAYNDTFHTDFNEATYRTRQIRYTFNPTKEVKVAFAVEQNLTGGGSTKLGQSLTGAVQYAADWGSVQAALLYQKKEDSNLTGGGTPANTRTTVSGTGTSFNIGGSWNITPKDTVGLRIIKGGSQGGSSVYGIKDGFYTKGSSYSFYTSTSIDLGYSHTWNDAFTTNLGFGQISFPKDVDAFITSQEKQTVTEFFINTNWNITKTCQFGLEYFDSQAKESDYSEVVKVDGTATNKIHNNGFNLMFTYNLF